MLVLLCTLRPEVIHVENLNSTQSCCSAPDVVDPHLAGLRIAQTRLAAVHFKAVVFVVPPLVVSNQLFRVPTTERIC